MTDDGSQGDRTDYPSLNIALWDKRKPEVLDNVKLTLEGTDLWRKFHELTTEMIITKTGRNMFPVVTFKVSGLEPDARYFVVMEICLASDFRFKFVNSNWKIAGKAEQQLPANARLYIHPDSPATGAQLMQDSIRMKTAKLTNNPMNKNAHIILTSMHKYIPFIHVVKTSDIMNLHWSPTATFSFPETEFIAVTAYQNDEVTRLKINNNPFAKGFRENGLSSVKRKHSESLGTNRKRHCSERNSVSSVDGSVQSLSPTLDTDSSRLDIRYDQLTRYNNYNESHPRDWIETQADELSTAVTNININSNTVHYPFPPLYPSSLYQHYHHHHHHHEQPFWRFPLLYNPPPPPLLPSYLFPFPYHPSLLVHHLNSLPQITYPECNSQPFDYSTRDKSS